MTIDLDGRKTWPPELRILLDRHPRATWTQAHSADARFWLEVHAVFRRQCAVLQSAADDYRASASASTPHEFAVRICPQVREMIAGVRGHHQIEDFHYFPLFRTVEPRIARGFDALEHDHLGLSAAIAATLRAVDDLLTAVHASDAPASTYRHAAELYLAASERLYRDLRRHLDDEEDLVIPLLLDRAARR